MQAAAEQSCYCDCSSVRRWLPWCALPLIPLAIFFTAMGSNSSTSFFSAAVYRLQKRCVCCVVNSPAFLAIGIILWAIGLATFLYRCAHIHRHLLSLFFSEQKVDRCFVCFCVLIVVTSFAYLSIDSSRYTIAMGSSVVLCPFSIFLGKQFTHSDCRLLCLMSPFHLFHFLTLCRFIGFFACLRVRFVILFFMHSFTFRFSFLCLFSVLSSGSRRSAWWWSACKKYDFFSFFSLLFFVLLVLFCRSVSFFDPLLFIPLLGIEKWRWVFCHFSLSPFHPSPFQCVTFCTFLLSFILPFPFPFLIFELFFLIEMRIFSTQEMPNCNLCCCTNGYLDCKRGLVFLYFCAFCSLYLRFVFSALLSESIVCACLCFFVLLLLCLFLMCPYLREM